VLAVALVGRHDQVERLPDRLFGAVAVDLLRASVPRDEYAVQRTSRDRVVGGVEDGDEIVRRGRVRAIADVGLVAGVFGSKVEEVSSRLGCLLRSGWSERGAGVGPAASELSIGSARPMA
jgi:hypothetical protein